VRPIAHHGGGGVIRAGSLRVGEVFGGDPTEDHDEERG
jgi:hypothetical protein